LERSLRFAGKARRFGFPAQSDARLRGGGKRGNFRALREYPFDLAYHKDSN